MAIVKLEKIQLVGLQSDAPAIMNYLSKQGCLELKRNAELEAAFAERKLGSAPHAYRSLPKAKDFSTAFEQEVNHLAAPTAYPAARFSEQAVEFADMLTECQRRIDFLDKQILQADLLSPRKKPLFSLKRAVAPQSYTDMTERQKELMDFARQFAEYTVQIEQLKLNLQKQKVLLEQLEVWRNLRLENVDFKSRFRYFLGTLRDQEQVAALQAALAAREDIVAACQLVSADQGALAVLVAVHEESQALCERLLSNCGVKALPTLSLLLPANGVDFKAYYAEQEQEAQRLQAALTAATAACKNLTVHVADWEILSDFYRIQHERLGAINNSAASGQLFVLEAFIPAKVLSPLFADLQAHYAVAMTVLPVGEDESVPVLLDNPAPFKPYESVIEEFSMPDYKEDIDPTMILAPCYAFFFGAMLSDIGYGLIFFLAALYLLLTKKVQGNTKRFMWIFAAGGFFAILWGLALGSFFGDLPAAVAKTFGSDFALRPLFADPFKEPMLIMITSVVLGMAHIALGMLLNIYKLCKNGEARVAFTEIAPWYFIFGGVGLTVAGYDWGKWLSLAACAVIVLLSPKDSKNPLMQLISGILKLYDITAFVGDILSYTRITALILSTSVIAMVVNMFASMIGFSFPGVIFSVVILLAGHTMNIALSGLSAYVHTTRLHYVELFGKFYSGGGEMFKPLTLKTKYTEPTRLK